MPLSLATPCFAMMVCIWVVLILHRVGLNSGILHGEPLWQPDGGMVAGALQFDGMDDYVETDFVLNPAGGAFSSFAWVKGGSLGQAIISQINSLEGTAMVWLGADPSAGKLLTGIRPPSGRSDAPPMISDFVISDGEWHHVGILVTELMVRHLYVDGIKVAFDTKTVELLSSDGGLYIGVGKDLKAGSFFSGLIDDVCIYNNALSAEETEVIVQ